MKNKYLKVACHFTKGCRPDDLAHWYLQVCHILLCIYCKIYTIIHYFDKRWLNYNRLVTHRNSLQQPHRASQQCSTLSSTVVGSFLECRSQSVGPKWKQERRSVGPSCFLSSSYRVACPTPSPINLAFRSRISELKMKYKKNENA